MIQLVDITGRKFLIPNCTLNDMQERIQGGLTWFSATDDRNREVFVCIKHVVSFGEA